MEKKEDKISQTQAIPILAIWGLGCAIYSFFAPHTFFGFGFQALAIAATVLVFQFGRTVPGLKFWKSVAVVGLVLAIISIIFPGGGYYFGKEFYDTILYLVRR